ncbi:MAG: indolepyruvate oxidoreductase subunit beta [Oscillospiraceae bacterium]|nr:indolepyruvate oxidoreductase subunit beta [Oscillospiraceae bacterium]
MINCILAGVGGQGTVLASKLIAQTAMEQGHTAHTAETIGMAQRGGSVVSHVRIGQGAYSPLIPKGSAQILIAFEPAEAVRTLPYLAPDGVMVVAQKAVKPVTAALSGSNYDGAEMLRFLREDGRRLILVDGEAILRQCGSSKALNVALLGAAAASGVLGFSVADVEKAIRARIPQKYLDINLQALSLGAAAGGQNK